MAAAMLGGLGRFLSLRPPVPTFYGQHRTFASMFQSFSLREIPSSSLPAGCGILTRTIPSHWSLLPVRTKKRGMEYQPKFIKRRRTHGWLKRISTRGGIEVILRRMLKGRKSLTVDQRS